MTIAINLNKIVFLSLCFAFIGCAEKRDTIDLPLTSLNYSLDTVVIDPGDEILFLNSGLYPSRLSDDKRFLYNFDQSTLSLECVDLDILRLDSKIQFDREGPDGVGDNIWELRVVGKDSILLAGFGTVSLFNVNGKKLADINLAEIGKDQQSGDLWNVLNPMQLPGNPSLYMGIVSAGRGKGYVVAQWDAFEDEYRTFSLSLFEKSKQFQADFDDGTSAMSIGAGEYLEIENHHVIMGFSASSAIHVLGPGAEDFRLITYEEHLVPAEKTVVFPEKNRIVVYWLNYLPKLQKKYYISLRFGTR